MLDYVDEFKTILALRLTCNKWHNQISVYLERKLGTFLPLSYQQYLTPASQLKISERFIDARAVLAELQVYDFKSYSEWPSDAATSTTETAHQDLLHWRFPGRVEFLPWDSNLFVTHLATMRSTGGRTVIEPSRVRVHSLALQVPIFERFLPASATFNCFAINSRLKYFGFCWCTSEERIFAVYSVNDSANHHVTLMASVTYDRSPPDFFQVTMVIRDDATVWLAGDNKVFCYSLLSSSFIDVQFPSKNYCAQVHDLNGNLIILHRDKAHRLKEKSVPIFHFDRLTKKSKQLLVVEKMIPFSILRLVNDLIIAEARSESQTEVSFYVHKFDAKETKVTWSTHIALTRNSNFAAGLLRVAPNGGYCCVYTHAQDTLNRCTFYQFSPSDSASSKKKLVDKEDELIHVHFDPKFVNKLFSTRITRFDQPFNEDEGGKGEDGVFSWAPNCKHIFSLSTQFGAVVEFNDNTASVNIPVRSFKIPFVDSEPTSHQYITTVGRLY